MSEQPPSAKLAVPVLDHEGPLTQQGISEESMLSPRTVRYALSGLDSVGLIEEEISFRDARQRIYSLSETGEAVAQPDR